MNEPTRKELEHLMRLMAPPFTEAWKAYCWHKAKALATDPIFSELPAALTDRMKEQKANQ